MTTLPANQTVLLTTNSKDDARLLTDTLSQAKDGPFSIVCTKTLAEALIHLDQGGIDIVLLDLRLPDSEGIATFEALFAHAPSMAVMVLCDENSEAFGVKAVERGAQGYLSREYFGNALLSQTLRSCIQRKSIEESLFVERERTRVTLESIGDGVLSTDVASRVTYLNGEAERLTGWVRNDALGHPLGEVFHVIEEATRQTARNPVEQVIRKKRSLPLQANSILVSKDGVDIPVEDSIAPIFDRTGAVTGAVITFRDASEAKALSRQMAHMAQHDYMTGLPNRMLFADRLSQAIAYAKRHHTQLAVLFQDLDNFKHINDSLGHSMGDKLLESVAQRLCAQVRHSDTVSRYGGDEFIVLVLEDKLAGHAAITAEKMLRALSAPHHLGGHELNITTSIGISTFPADGDDAETLIKNADNAMYHAKRSGRNNFQFFNNQMNLAASARQSIEAELHQALARKEFVLYYQPKVDLPSGRITGVEALIRWQHPSKGLLLPLAFIEVAEESGLIIQIGQYVLKQACHDARVWMKQGMPAMSMAVNVSALEFRHKDFIDNLRVVLQESGLPPSLLQLELTESVLMQNVEATAAILRTLKGMGIQLAIDDFGTGYSSLSYLRHFPTDILKIDRSFVHDIIGGKDNGIIVSAIISMGTSLKQRIIAEGIETPEQLAFLNEHHCGEGQGNLFSRPLPASAIPAIFQAGLAAASKPSTAGRSLGA